ncbi:MAG TPA: hypothetical protein VLJ37_11560 [bacterium]|nr:hypothetical protein [bacterium]
MHASASPYIIPLTTVPGILIQSIGISASYRLAAERLLAQAWRLDAHLCGAVEAVPAEGRADYFLNLDRLDWKASREIFLEIRGHKEGLEPDHSLLGHVAGLVDYISHLTTNLLPLTCRGNPRLLASVPASGSGLSYAGIDGPTFEWSIALYMGISPFPVFGLNIPYADDGIARSLSPFGFGAVTYLTLALQPELATDRHVPAEITRDGFSRPVARPRLEVLADRSLVLKED